MVLILARQLWNLKGFFGIFALAQAERRNGEGLAFKPLI